MSASVRRWILVVLSVAAIASWFSAIDRRLTQEGERAIEKSDRAFDEGHLRNALEEAFRASTSAALGVQFARQPLERLRAIAVGSEATGRHWSALLAWYGLATISREFGRVNAGVARWGQEAEQHVEYLLRKGIDAQESGAHPTTHAPVITASSVPVGGARCAPWFLAAITLAAVGVSMLRWDPSIRVHRAISGSFVVGTLLVIAVTSWCLGWTIM
jgi:hypothetical protein